MIDLHTHSTKSDGMLSPRELVKRAANQGITALALTDHDTITGNEEASAAALENGIRFAPGVEISCRFTDIEIHLLGYWINSRNEYLQNALSEIVEWRDQRNLEIVERLNQSGIPINMDMVLRIAGEGVLGRPHIGEALRQMGYAASISEAFAKYLKPGCPAYVPRKKLTVQQGIDLIHQAGGINSLAHPGEYVFTHDSRFKSAINKLVDLGLEGMEVYYPRHSVKDTALFLKTAEKYDLAITGGTDFHGYYRSDNIEIGSGINANMNLDEEIFDQLLRRYEKKNC